MLLPMTSPMSSPLTSQCGCDCPFTDATFLRGVCGPTLAVFLGIVEMVLRGHCDVAEPCQRAHPDAFQRRGQDEYDFIVVGAGVAGSVVAARLSEDLGRSVLLLEAGPEEPLATLVPAFAVKGVGTFLDWQFETEPEPNACLARGGRCQWPRGKMVAGTGGLQGMMYVRGHPVIYDTWESMGNPGWGYRDVLPYFLKAEGNRELRRGVRPPSPPPPPSPSKLGLKLDEEFHSDDGPLSVQRFPHRPGLAMDLVRAGHEMGYDSPDLNGRNQTGFAIAQMMVHRGLRGSTARMYLRPAMGRPNLVVNTLSLVTRVIIDPNTNRATGVEFIDRRGKTRTVWATKEVILTAGAVGSPHILLLSGVGPTEELEEVGVSTVADLPVGRNLHNHVAAQVNFIIDDVPPTKRAKFAGDDFLAEDDEEAGPMSMEALHMFLDKRAGPLASTGLTQVTAFIASKYAEQKVPDVQIFFDGYHAGCASELKPALRCALPNVTHAPGNFYDMQYNLDLDDAARTAARSDALAAAGKSVVAVEGCPMTRKVSARPTNVRTLSKGRLRLRSADPREPPSIVANYFHHERDLLVLVEGMKTVARLTNTRTLRKWGVRLDTTPVKGCQHLKFASDEYWACSARALTGPENHQAGSCRMGPAGDPHAVVDPELRLHGIPNLRVMDASVMPIPINANPIAGIIMIAEKGSDMIRQTWRERKT